MGKNKKYLAVQIIAHVILIIGAFTMLVPFFWMLSSSLKSLGEVFVFPPKLFGERLVWENYTHISGRFNYFNYFMNSVKVSVWVVFFQVMTSASAGFVFAKLNFPGRDKIFLLYLGTMMIPFHVTVITNYLQMSRYGLVNTPGMVSASDFWTLLILSLDFLLTMGIYVFTFPRRKSSNATGAVAAFLYVPVMMSFLLRTRSLSHGIWLYLLIFICSSVSDVCALAVGMAIGRHKLAPVLSPKKTIEGAIGGIAGSALVSCLIAVLIRRFEPGINAVPVFLIIGICGSIIGQTGDLAASAIKRNHSIKDYGHLIPGHGGIMDRFDSVIFTAPVIYYLSFLLMARI